MFTERLQILVSPAQRSRLEADARRLGLSLSAVVREALDVRFGGVTREHRIRAFEEIQAMHGGKFLPVDELDRIVEEERAHLLDPTRTSDAA